MTVKCLKMVSGEELLGEVEEGIESTAIKDPVVVVVVGEGKLALVPWLPLSTKPEAKITNTHVIASYEPNEQLINHYKGVVGGIVTAPANALPPTPPNFGK